MASHRKIHAYGWSFNQRLHLQLDLSLGNPSRVRLNSEYWGQNIPEQKHLEAIRLLTSKNTATFGTSHSHVSEPHTFACAIPFVLTQELHWFFCSIKFVCINVKSSTIAWISHVLFKFLPFFRIAVMSRYMRPKLQINLWPSLIWLNYYNIIFHTMWKKSKWRFQIKYIHMNLYIENIVSYIIAFQHWPCLDILFISKY